MLDINEEKIKELKDVLSSIGDDASAAIIGIVKTLDDTATIRHKPVSLRDAFRIRKNLLKDCNNMMTAIQSSEASLQSNPGNATDITNTEYTATLFMALHIVSKYIVNYGMFQIDDIDFCIDHLYNGTALSTRSKLTAIMYGIPCENAPDSRTEIRESVKELRGRARENIKELGNRIVNADFDDINQTEFEALIHNTNVWAKLVKMCDQYIGED